MSALAEVTRVEVAGVHARAVLAGPRESDEAAVFVHGNPGSAGDWHALAEAAAPVVRAVALDLPDFGDTAGPEGFDHTVPAYAEFLGAALDALGVRRVHLVLHDFGGPIGLVWASERLDRVASVTLIDTGLLPGYRWHRLARIWRTPVLGELLQGAATRASFRRLVNRGEPRGLPRAFLDEMYDHYDRRTRRAVLELYRATDDPGALAEMLTGTLRARDLPALVVWGEDDAYIPSSFAARQREAFPSADVHVLPASGHWPFVDAADTVERLLLEHLARAAGARSAGT